MIYNGIVSSLNTDLSKARVYIADKDYITPEIPVASHIVDLKPNDNVVVAFVGDKLVNGLIIENFKKASYTGQDASFTHTQILPLTIWVIKHNLNKYPSVTVVDSAGSVVIGDVKYISENEIRISFSASFSGVAYLN